MLQLRRDGSFPEGMQGTPEETKLQAGKRRPADRRARGQAGKFIGPTERGSSKGSQGRIGDQVLVPCPVTGGKAKFGLFVDGVIRNTECRFLIDTGSSDTVVSSSVYHTIPKEQRPTLETDGLNIEQVDGSPLAAMGTAWVEVQVGKTVSSVKVIFADMPYAGILGMNFLLSTGASLDLQTLQLKMNGERIRCTNGAGEPFIGRVVVTETKVIPSGHEAVVPGVIRRLCEVVPGPVLVEPVEGGGELGQGGLILARTLVECDQEVLPLRVLNPNREKRVVRQGSTIGMASQVEVDQSQNICGGGVDVGRKLPGHL